MHGSAQCVAAFTAAVTLALAAGSCGSRESPDPRGVPHAEDAAPHASTSTVDSASSASAAGPAPGTASRFFVRMDPAYRACTADADCQVIPDCRCRACIASKSMHVQPCPEPCTASPCAGRLARCSAGVCVAAGAPNDAAATDAIESARAALQLVFDDPRFVAALHADSMPERVPVLIAWEPVVPRPAWKIAGQAAQFQEGFPKKPHLLPRFIAIDSDQGSFELEYAPEGIVVGGEVERRAGTWALKSLSIVER